MITIKKFASLCGCGTQTLRYYDKIGLLKPVQVDSWSGYRYYEESQAIDFVKIKNLQAADFSIDEIKALLSMPDSQVYEAFDRKIAQQTEKLERIKQIQQSYLTEINNMEKLVQGLVDYLMHGVSDFEVLREFGLSPQEGAPIVQMLREYITSNMQQHLPQESEMKLIVNDQVIRGADNAAVQLSLLKEGDYGNTVLLGDETVGQTPDPTPENSEILWECHGWKFVHEFLDRIPTPEAEHNYSFFFKLTGEKYPAGLEFPLFMVAAMLPRVDPETVAMGCSVEHSPDAENHFYLLRTK